MNIQPDIHFRGTNQCENVLPTFTREDCFQQHNHIIKSERSFRVHATVCPE